jgi:hypothetical protein
MTWESATALVEDVEAQNALAKREAWDRVSRVEAESIVVLASARGEAEDHARRIPISRASLWRHAKL